MNDNVRFTKSGGTATVILLAFLLFYLPSMLAIFTHRREPMEWTLLSVMMATFYTAVFCINYFLLVPRLLIHKESKAMYFILNICLILLVCSFIPVWFESHGGLPQPGHRTKTSTTLSQYLIGYVGFIIRDSVMMILAAGLAFALRLSRERENVRRRELELNAERRQIELKSLKAQLNPHFLFNSLNNIYALIGFAPERAQKALHDLSSLLRYMIYDSSSPLVPLQKEISFISEYVELMKLRLNGNVVLKCDIQSDMPQDFHIAPLLFLTLVENAFKHLGTSSGETFIAISIHIDNHRLICSVRNSYSQNEKSRVGDERPSGVGLENVKRQLNLLYPEEYTMSAIGEKGVFSALLAIETVALKGNNSTDKNVFL